MQRIDVVLFHSQDLPANVGNRCHLPAIEVENGLLYRGIYVNIDLWHVLDKLSL